MQKFDERVKSGQKEMARRDSDLKLISEQQPIGLSSPASSQLTGALRAASAEVSETFAENASKSEPCRIKSLDAPKWGEHAAYHRPTNAGSVSTETSIRPINNF